MIAQHAIDEAIGHLGAAIIQSVPADDQIIMDHVRAAHDILTIVARAQRVMLSVVGSPPTPANKGE